MPLGICVEPKDFLATDFPSTCNNILMTTEDMFLKQFHLAFKQLCGENIAWNGFSIRLACRCLVDHLLVFGFRDASLGFLDNLE
jgi:hypothetical protein